MAMNPEIKARWVVALRSDKYEQVKGQLRTQVGFCCLGVLCDLHDPAGWTADDVSPSKFVFDANGGMPPTFVREWAGFERENLGIHSYFKVPKVIIHGEFLSVDEHNDNGRTFAEIADAIEAQL